MKELIFITIGAIGLYTVFHALLRKQYKRTDLDYSDNLFDETDIYDGE